MSQPDVPKLEIARPTVFNGWIVCHLTFQGVRHRVLASDSFPPFWPLLNLLYSIRSHSLPDHYMWSEEGRLVLFEAWPVQDRADRFRLRVTRECNPEMALVDAEYDAQTFIDAYLEPLREFAAWRVPAREHLSWELTEDDIALFEGRQPEEGSQKIYFKSRGPWLYGTGNARPEEEEEDDDDDQAAAIAQLPTPLFPFSSPGQMHECLMEYLKTGHHLGPIDEWDPPKDPEKLWPSSLQ